MAALLMPLNAEPDKAGHKPSQQKLVRKQRAYAAEGLETRPPCRYHEEEEVGPTMCSEKKIEANRLNAQRSTGPKTPEGKARVAKNALKHGFFAQDVVLLGEDPDNEFPRLLAGLHEEWLPSSPTEQYLVETLASAMWKLRRAHRLVTGYWEQPPFQQETRRSYPPGPKGNVALIRWYGETIQKLDKHEAHLHRIVEKTLRQLHQLRRDRENAPIDSPDTGSKPQLTHIQQDPLPFPDLPADVQQIAIPPSSPPKS